MEATVASKSLKTAFSKLALLPGAKDRTTLLRVESDGLYLEAAAGGAFLTIRLEASGCQPGRAVVDGSALGGLSVAAKEIRLYTTDKDKLAFSAGGFRGTTAQYQDDRANTIESQRPIANADCTVEIPVAKFLSVLRSSRVQPSVDNPSHGTRVTLTNEEFSATCSDIYRAVLAKSDTSGFTGTMEFFCNVDFLVSLLTYADQATARMVVQGGLLHVETGDVTANLPLLQQRGPNQVRAIIESLDHPSCLGGATLSAKDLRTCLVSTNSIIGGSSYESRLVMQRTGSSISLLAESPKGSATAEHELTDEPVLGVSGDFRVVVSIRYLDELLRVYPDDLLDVYVWENMVELRSRNDSYSAVMPTVIT